MKVFAVILMGLWLLLCAYQDFKEKKVTFALLIVGGIILPVVFLSIVDLSIISRVGGLVIGGFILLLSKLTRGQIGIGDGIIICITGVCMGFKNNLSFLLWGLSFAALASLLLILFKKAGRKETIPFIPFLFLAYLGGVQSL